MTDQRIKIARVPLDQAYASLRSAPTGLGGTEAARRVGEFGPNRLEELQRKHWLASLAREFANFFALILWLAAALALVAEWRDPDQGMALLAAAIVGVILINGVFSFWQEFRAERAMAALRRLLPVRVQALRDGSPTQVDADALVPGDVILLEAGDGVPADCRVIESTALKLDNATMTGEAKSVGRSSEVGEEGEGGGRGGEDLAHSGNVLLMGTSIAAGSAQALVFATGMHTRFGAIARLTQVTGTAESLLQREIRRLSKWVALLATTIGVIFFLIGLALGLPFWANLIFAIGIIVANVPEGLLPTVTLALAMATQRMAKRHALVRHLAAVETLGATTVIVSDKTGTLTRSEMAVVRLAVAEGDVAVAALRGEALTRHHRLIETASLCHDLRQTLVDGELCWLGDPMEAALLRLSRSVGAWVEMPAGWERLGELPFDTVRKRQSVIVATPAGRVLYCKGAPETVLPLCDAVEAGGALDAAARAHWRERQHVLASQGLRVIAFAWRRLDAAETDAMAERGLTLCGLVGLQDPPRPEVAGALASCKRAGIRVIMCTGDHPDTARAIAREIGLVEKVGVGDMECPARGMPNGDRFVLGAELARMSDTQLQLLLDLPDVHFARMAPEQKLRVVEALKRKQEVVAVTGDGVNDAPALKAADIGVAMGLSGTDVAREAADMVLLDDNFATIVHAVREGRRIFDNIRKFIRYALTGNSGEIWVLFLAPLLGLPVPLLPIHILWVNLVTDGLPGLALAGEPAERGVMQRPPRAPGESIFAHGLWQHALWVGLLIGALCLGLQAWALQVGDTHWQSMVFTTLTLTQMAHLLAIRSETEPLWRLGLGSNRPLLGAVLLSVALQLATLYVPALQAIFHTQALDAAELGLCFAAAGLVWAVVEVEKAWRRRTARSQSPAQNR
jgi:calcium-translocating P-type ATPase